MIYNDYTQLMMVQIGINTSQICLICIFVIKFSFVHVKLRTKFPLYIKSIEN